MFKDLGTSKPKDLNRIAKINYSHPWLIEIDLSLLNYIKFVLLNLYLYMVYADAEEQ
jgi:hypothetical protein